MTITPPSWGLRRGARVSPDPCDLDGLRGVLEAVARGAFGPVERVKGIARAGPGWVHFDVAGGRSSMTAFAASEGEEARVVAIGRAVDEERLRAAFAACAVPADELSQEVNFISSIFPSPEGGLGTDRRRP